MRHCQLPSWLFLSFLWYTIRDAKRIKQKKKTTATYMQGSITPRPRAASDHDPHSIASKSFNENHFPRIFLNIIF